MVDESPSRSESLTGRRRFLGLTATAGAVGVVGCLGGDDETGDSGDSTGGDGSDGSTGSPDDEPWDAPLDSTAVSWDDLGDLEGEITVYSGRTRDQIDPLFEALESEYPDLTINRDYDDNSAQLNKLREEGDASPADVFYTQSSGALAAFKQDGLTRDLPADVVDAIDGNYSDPDGQWTGVSGRVRAIQYNTELWDGDADDLPDDIFAYAEDDRFEGIISTRPNSGTFRSFIVAMIEMEGEEATREWIRGMVEDQDATLYSSGSQQAEEVHSGNQVVGLGNQYYAGRILSNNPDSPLDVAFTNNDPGCLFNVSGVAIPQATDNVSLAAEFCRHVLAAEGQEFFVETNGEYPVVDGVDYVGDLPALSEINPPEFDLNALADVERAVDLLREEGMTV
ncbi:extracellular solute-binding protein [Halorubrum sp. DTA98]|uniref:extracellular solute-binding protein n=1 Tax=Halorubrum sp. DTA98 TaxID=3402163 RepID=UPI003AAAA9C9